MYIADYRLGEPCMLLLCASPAGLLPYHLQCLTLALWCLQELWLQHVFQGVGPDVKQYQACSMICFFQGHHTAFAVKNGCWVSFDDALSSHVGNWQEVMQKCKDGKMQPVYIFYEQKQV